MDIKRVCESLRFEDRSLCLSYVPNHLIYCQHHHEVRMYLRETLNFESRYYLKGIVIETEMDEKAIEELKNYMIDYAYSMNYKENDASAFWWMGSRISVKREKEECYSLMLKTGQLCSKPIGSDEKYCRYHKLQHDILCTEYHAKRRASLRTVSYGTKCFIEFVLRKEFDLIHGYALPYATDFNHRKRYGYLFDGMFDHPYPTVNRGVIDYEFYRDAEIMSAVIDRELKSRIKINFYLDDNSDIDDAWTNYVPAVKIKELPHRECEDWDQDLL